MASTMINLRAEAGKRALIDRAAEAVGKNRSEFMLDAACREATAVLLDRRFFHLDEKTYKRFKSGFAVSPLDPMTLMITVADAEKILSNA